MTPRTLRAAFAAVCMLSLAACTGGEQAGDPEIIDPQGEEFQQALSAARARLAPAETAVRSAVEQSEFVGTREETGCLLGNQGPKGEKDVWDSECDLRRSLGLRSKDPVATLFAADNALTRAGYQGTWFPADGTTALRPSDVADGTVPRTTVRSAIYTNGGGDAISLQIGRVGEKQLFLVNSPRPGYFVHSTGEDWESVAPRGSVLSKPIVAVELRVPHFIRRPATA